MPCGVEPTTSKRRAILFLVEEEIFLPIKGFEPRFKISNHGRLLSINGKYGGEKILSPHIGQQGYYITTLRMKPLKLKIRIHTLVAEHFISAKPEGQRMTVNHIDGNKLNNYFENLEWIEAKENCLHAVRIGLHNIKGENHPNAKLTEREIKEIRRLAATGDYYHREIGEMFKTSRKQIGDIINRKNWGWLL